MTMIKLNPLLTDNAVVQAEKDFFLTGQVSNKEEVQVSFGELDVKTTSDESGYFSLILPPQKYGTIGDITVKTELAEKKVQVQFGDVFLFGGQSNIEFQMADEAHFQAEKERVAQTSIDLFFINVPQVEYEDNIETIPSTVSWEEWKPINSETLAEVSAIAYYSMRRYKKKYPNRIVGIVNCSKGGTSASSWMSLDFLKKSKNLNQNILVPYQQAITGKTREEFDVKWNTYQAIAESYYSLRNQWIEEHPNLSLIDIKKKIGHSPWPPPITPYSFLRPAGLYYTMFKKIVPYTFLGVIWYQGEEDTQHGYLYEELLSMLMKQWRADLQAEVPFYIVQLPLCVDKPNHDWPAVRQAQAKISENMKATFLVTSLDCGLPDNIHPPEKNVLGERIGEIIQQRYYSSSPTANVIAKEKDKIVIEIKNAESLKVTCEECIHTNTDNFTVSIKKNMIEISVENNQELTTVEYAWSNAPIPALFNEVGYPVSPFKIECKDS
ncbi:sialate O-acetylesterase [Enterococcus sp. AZ196]|uniref:sialate O-acetylesterase n=1 Tax=Enterococcus sp. AZ196 TaxID=2774659 RepID=UPI003D26C8CE